MKWVCLLVLILSSLLRSSGSNPALAAQIRQADVGWSDDFDLPGRWREDMSQLGYRAAAQRSFEVKDGHGEFCVSEPRRAARWRETTEPIWAAEHKYFAIRYRARGIAPQNGSVVMLRPGSVGPVTPGGTNAENPFARGANLAVINADELVQDGGWHVISKDLTAQLATAQLDQIIITVGADAKGQACFEVEYMRFSSSDPRRGLADYVPIQPTDSVSCSLPGCSPQAFHPVDLHALSNASPKEVLPELGIRAPWVDSRWFTFAGVPFAAGAAAVTTVQGRETLTVPIAGRASEIYLLLGANFSGIGDTEGAYATGSVDTGKAPIEVLREPERFAVDVEYAGGAVDEFFPFNVLRQAFVMENHSLGLYLVAPDATRTVERVKLRDRMSNGSFVLLGASINTQQPLHPEASWTGKSLPPPAALKKLPAHEPEVRLEGGRLALENTFYQYEFSTDGSLRLLHAVNRFGGGDILGSNQPGGLFSCAVANPTANLPESKIFRMADFHLAEVAVDGKQATVSMSSPDAAFPLQIHLKLEVEDSPALDAGLVLENAGDAPLRVDLSFPEFADLHLGSAEDTYYLFPRGAAVITNEDQKIEAAYSDRAPMQFMDVFNPRENSGLGIMIEDADLHPKMLSLEKQGERESMAVSYSYPVDGPGNAVESITIDPHAKFEAPAAVLLVHNGDWRPMFRAYRDWANTWYHSLPRKEWFERVFTVRRDYPVGGTGKLFDIAANRYTLDKLIAEGKQIGGIDMIDISGWAYSPRYGRVGEYRDFTLGGRENFRQNIAQAESQGIPVGLYTEGYLVDLNSLIGEQHGKEWQMANRLGTPRAWPGASSEVFECPYAKGWQDYMSASAARALTDTGAKAFYLDEYGFSRPDEACFNPTHGHAPGATPAGGERQMMRAVRAAMDTVDPQAALYIEEIPPDANAPYVDGAFCYALNFSDEALSPAKINLYRFAFPRLKLFDMVSAGINPTAMTAAEMKLSFFNGNGLWIKGDLDSWYSPEVRAFITKAHRALREHSEAFTSDDLEPLVPTLAPGILANRFSSAKETVYTFYNRGFRTIRGRILEIPPDLAGRKFVDLFTGKPLTTTQRDGGTFLEIEVAPRDVAAVGVISE